MPKEKALFTPDREKEGKAPPWGGFRYAFCNESMQGMAWEEQCEMVAGAGYKGIEIAPFSLVKQSVEELSSKTRKGMAASMKEAGIQCAGLHWLLSPPPAGLHFTSSDRSVREKTISYLRKLIDFCGDLGGKVMVFGSPQGRSTEGKISVEEAQRNFIGGMAKIAEHARERGVKILIEALTRNQTDVINTLEEALRIIKELDHPAIQAMFDFHNTADEKLSLAELIDRYYPFIHHVHVMEMDGKYLGAGNGGADYLSAFQLLKDRGYDKWVSLEVFDFSPGSLTIAHESMRTLKAMEANLK